MMGRRILGAVASVALVAALTPAAAHALQVEAAQAHEQQQAASAAQAPAVRVQAASSKATVYVVTGVEVTGQTSMTQTRTCNYNGKGLVKRVKASGGSRASSASSGRC